MTSRRPRPCEDLALLSGMTALTSLLLVWSWPLWGAALQLACPFRAVTGIACPTCGGTRALLAAARGELVAALRLNPLVALATTGLLLWVPLSSAWVAGRWPRPDLRRLSGTGGRAAARAGVAAALANWLWVVLSGTV